MYGCQNPCILQAVSGTPIQYAFLAFLAARDLCFTLDLEPGFAVVPCTVFDFRAIFFTPL